jgi:hypothetical protein
VPHTTLYELKGRLDFGESHRAGKAAAKPFAQVSAKTGSECPQLPKLMSRSYAGEGRSISRDQ